MDIDAQSFDRIARNVFAPCYPLIAGQMIARTGVSQGVCLDIGCGSGYLGSALAGQTNLFVSFFDKAIKMLFITKKTIMENNLQNRAASLLGDVKAIPLQDRSVDLAVSRGSVFYWEDLTKAFQEIHRILNPGGWAYLGGGFGSEEIKNSILKQMKNLDKGGDKFSKKVKKNLGPETRAWFESSARQAGISSYFVIDNPEEGLWLIFRK